MHIRQIILIILLLCLPASAYALEGDWEVGGNAEAILLPSPDIYGGGAEFFARYSVIDGLSLDFGAGFYGARQKDIDLSLGLYTLRFGIFYALDVLQWVPGVGLHVSALFSENEDRKWHRDGHGMGMDFDIFVQYRGIRHLGIGIIFSYHLVFVDVDYMTVGISFSWNSGMF